MNLSESHSHIHVTAILPCERHLRWGRHPPFGVYPL